MTAPTRDRPVTTPPATREDTPRTGHPIRCRWCAHPAEVEVDDVPLCELCARDLVDGLDVEDSR